MSDVQSRNGSSVPHEGEGRACGDWRGGVGNGLFMIVNIVLLEVERLASRALPYIDRVPSATKLVGGRRRVRKATFEVL